MRIKRGHQSIKQPMIKGVIVGSKLSEASWFSIVDTHGMMFCAINITSYAQKKLLKKQNKTKQKQNKKQRKKSFYSQYNIMI